MYIYFDLYLSIHILMRMGPNSVDFTPQTFSNLQRVTHLLSVELREFSVCFRIGDLPPTYIFHLWRVKMMGSSIICLGIVDISIPKSDKDKRRPEFRLCCADGIVPEAARVLSLMGAQATQLRHAGTVGIPSRNQSWQWKTPYICEDESPI